MKKKKMRENVFFRPSSNNNIGTLLGISLYLPSSSSSLSLSLPPSFRHVFRSTEGRVVCRTGPYYIPPPTTSTNIYILYISSIYIHIYYIGNQNKSKSKSKSKSQTTNQEISLSRRLSSSLVVVGRRLPISSKKQIQLTVGGSPLTYAQTSVYDQSSSPTSTQNS